jgi:uncharacterized protein YutE (UPF0331/DUF86 family)
MESFAVFRNRFVHLYWEVKKEEIYEKLNSIDVFKKFAEEIVKYLE